MGSPIPNINDYLTTAIKGRCFKNRDSSSEIVKILAFIPSSGERGSEAGVRVWYPLSNEYGFIGSSVFDRYVPCSSTEEDRVNSLAQTPPKRTEPDSVLAAAEVSGRKIVKRGYGGWTGVRSAADLR